MPQVGVAIAGIVTAVKTSAVFTFLTTTFVGKLLTTVALSALLRALQPKPKVNQGGIVTETTTTGEEVGQGAVLGYYSTAGHHLCPPMSHGNVGRVQNAYLTYVVALSDVPGAQLLNLIVNDEVVNLGGVAETEGFPALGTFAGHLWVRFYDGSQTAADPYLLSRYGVGSAHSERTGRPWQSDMVGRGMCYAIVTFRFNRTLYNALPSVRFVLNGIPLYDPRQDSTVGGSGPQRWTDRSTWSFTTNPKVMIYNIMRGIEIPFSGVWGPQVPAEDLPLSSWFAAMNACDQVVGGVAQYRAGYEFSVLEEPAEVIEELEKVCSGAMSEFGGVWKARAGEPGMPVYYFSDDDLIMDEGTTFVPFGSLNETYNGITARYPEPAQLWQAKEAPPRFNTALEAEDFGRRLVASLDLAACPYSVQVQRLMQAYIADERRFRRHSLALPPDAAVLEPLDVVGWTSPENGYIDKAFEVTEIGDDLGSMIQRLALREIDNADYDWAPEDEIAFDVPSVVIGRPAPVIVDLFTVSGITITDGAAQPRRPAILLEWSEDEFESMWGVRYEVRRTGSTEVQFAGVMNSPDARRFVVQGVLPNTAYDARIAFLFNGALEGAWTDWETATTPDVRQTAADIAASIIQQIEDGEAAAAAAADAAAAAQLTADGVRSDHDALVVGFTGTLGAAFSQVNTDLSALEGNLTSVTADLSAAYDSATGQVRASALSGYYTAAETDSAISAAQTVLRSEIGQRTLSRDFTEDGLFWSQSISGAPSSKPDLNAPFTFVTDTAMGRVVQLVGPASTNRHIVPKAYLPNVAGRRYRVTIVARHVGAFVGQSSTALIFLARRITSTFSGTVGDIFSATLTFAAPDTVQAFTFEWTCDGNSPLFVPFVYSAGSRFNVTGPTLQVSQIDVVDISAASEVSANLETNYYTRAATDGAISAAINSFETEFRDPATGQIKASALTGYYTSAATDGAISAARTQLEASIATVDQSVQGFQHITDAISKVTQGPAVTVTLGAASLGQAGTVIVTEGSVARNTTGTTNGAYITIPAERAILFAGQRIKIGVLARQPSSNPAASFGIAYSTSEVGNSDYMQATGALTGAWQWFTFYYNVPQAVAGDTDFIGIFGDHSKTGLSTEVARVYVEIAAVADELPEISNLSGQITDILGLNISPTSALATSLTSLETRAGDTEAEVTAQGSAISTLQGNASAGYLIKAQAGGAVSLLDLVAADDGVTPPTSVARVAADNILLDGSVSTNLLSVGRMNNLLENSNWRAGTASWIVVGTAGAAGSASSFSIRTVIGSFSSAAAPTGMIHQTSADSAGHMDIENRPIISRSGTRALGYPVTPGQVIEASAYLSAHRCRGEIRIRFFDANGESLSFSGVIGFLENNAGSATNPDLWQRVGGRFTAPANAASATIHIRKLGTLSGTDSYLFIHKPMLCFTHAAANDLTPYAPPGTTLIEGGHIATGAITAESGIIGNAAIVSAQIADAAISTAKIGLLQVDSARIANLTVGTGKIAGNAVSDNVSGYNGSGGFTSSTGWTTILSVSFTGTGAPVICGAWVRGIGIGAVSSTPQYRLVLNSSELLYAAAPIEESAQTLIRSVGSAVGTNTIFLQYRSNNGNQVNFSQATLFALQTKR